MFLRSALVFALTTALCTPSLTLAGDCALSPIQRLGKHLFFDSNLSAPPGQSCASCHGPNVGFTGPNLLVNATVAVYPGAIPRRFGNRKPPAAAYASFAPKFQLDPVTGTFSGGSFWDGRATGERLGLPVADQAQGPFLNPLEQNLPTGAAVVSKVCSGPYASLFSKVWGQNACQNPVTAYDRIALSIAAYESSHEVNAFTSKYDAVTAGQAVFSAQEARGRALFEGKAKCAACHAAPLFTDFSYDNLGIPRNPFNPFYFEPEWNPAGHSWVDPGLAGFLSTRSEWASLAEQNRGKHKVPTLRNVDKRPDRWFVKAYGHNGYFKSLRSIVHFYNTRDLLPRCPPDFIGLPGNRCWPEPEISANVNQTELGKLGLSSAEERDLVAFLRTLSDGYLKGCGLPGSTPLPAEDDGTSSEERELDLD